MVILMTMRMYNTFSTTRFWTKALEVSWQPSKKHWYCLFGKAEYEGETGAKEFMGEINNPTD